MPSEDRLCGDTHGFAVVIEASEEALRTAVRGAWQDGPSPDNPVAQGSIPASITLPPGIACGGYTVAGGCVQIPQEELDAHLWPAGNGIELKLGLHVRLAIHHPPVPAAELFELCADVRARIPLAAGGVGQRQLILRLQDVARADVRTTLTSGDPLAPRFDTLLTELVARALTAPDPAEPAGTLADFPHIGPTFGPFEISWPLGPIPFAVTAAGTISNDQASPQHAITAARVGDAAIISLPLHLRIAHLRPELVAQALKLPEPMGIITRMLISVPLEAGPGSYTARLSRATTVSVEALRPARGQEGANYTHNRRRMPLLEALIQAQVKEHSERVMRGLGDVCVGFPTVAEIEALIGEMAYQELVAYQQLAVWAPECNLGDFSVANLAVRALPDVLAIGLNAGENADLSAVSNFIPRGHQFAVAISGACLQQIIAQTRATYGFAEADLPRRLTVQGKEVWVKALDVVAAPPMIRMQGVGTMIDAFGTLTVHARARAEIGLSWEPHSSSAHTCQDIGLIIRGRPVVTLDMSLLSWVIAAILALITFATLRLVGSLIVVSGVFVLWAIGSYLGQRLVARAITEVIHDLAPWPPHLTCIGQARAVFCDPITLQRSGMTLAGDLALELPDTLPTLRESVKGKDCP